MFLRTNGFLLNVKIFTTWIAFCFKSVFPYFLTTSTLQTFRAYTAFPDFFKPVTKEWWKKLSVEFHQRIPFDGLWIVSAFTY